MAADEPLQGDDDDLLKGWKDIARFLHTSERTVQRWEHTLRLPVRRAGTPTASVVYATRTELRAWLESTEGVEAAADPSAADRASTATGTTAGSPGATIDAMPASPDSADDVPARVSGRLRWLWLVVVAIPLAGLVYWYAASTGWGRPTPTTQQATPAVLVLRLTSVDGTWSVVGIPYGGVAMSTQVGGQSLVLTAVRVGEESQVHVSTVERGAAGGAGSLGDAAVVTLRPGGSAAPTAVRGLAKIEWLRTGELPMPGPSQPRQAK